mgnify:CR=1 FL=1
MFSYDRIEEIHPGVTACFVQGCAGDQKPMPVDAKADSFVPREIGEIRDIGVQLGEAVNRVIASDALEPVEGPVVLTQTVLGLKTEPVDVAFVKRSLDDDRGFVQDWATYLLDRIENGAPVERVVPFEVQTVRFWDSLGIFTLAGEMSVEHGLRLKRELGAYFGNALVIAYTNHIVGYVPAKRQIPEGGTRCGSTSSI